MLAPSLGPVSVEFPEVTMAERLTLVSKALMKEIKTTKSDITTSA